MVQYWFLMEVELGVVRVGGKRVWGKGRGSAGLHWRVRRVMRVRQLMAAEKVLGRRNEGRTRRRGQ